jgi:hypothetical protein
MKLRPEERVALDVAKERAMRFLREQNHPVPASWVADAIWPDHSMRPQGAGAAASRILRRLDVENMVRWVSRLNHRGAVSTWGWVAIR